MVSRSSTLNEIKELVAKCINQVYVEDRFLFSRNRGVGVCERAIVFRFAHYLQDRIPNYFVDCDFNSSFEGYIDQGGNIIGQERPGKPIENENGTITKRFIDIIVHKRDYQTRNDLICFEIKKWNNRNSIEIRKDKNNLRVLTSQYGYIYGFHISFHREREKTTWEIFENGSSIEQKSLVFQNETER